MPNISLYFVRHGERIDHVDSSWATTSPCPQDPHLTNRGKTQARQTGKMIRDFAHESRSLPTSVPFGENRTLSEKGLEAEKEPASDFISLQRITPPESPNVGRFTFTNSSQQNHQHQHGVNTGDSKRPQHFAIVTSPFLRCSETAMEIAMGMKLNTNNNENNSQEKGRDKDLVTIAVESGLSGT
ncbi:hypothetical protein BGZ76_001055 [Entomortierella beljakovae]|nr:hypothetical protein BGZ76_001055 [Entomortierella beljakovae]